MKFGIFDQTVDMWLEKDASACQKGFTVCRPEQLECVWDDCGDADKVMAQWQRELGDGHWLVSREVRLPTVFNENETPHPRRDDTPEFPDKVSWDDLRTFLPTKEGATRPLVGKIGDSKFIVKFDCNTSYEHVMNEIFADDFIRAAGFNAPLSREYFVYSEEKSSHIRLAQYLDDCVALKKAYKYFPHWNWEVKKQVVDAYPVVALMANLDAFHNDNVLIDRKGKLWFVDNAASFAFRALGEKKCRETGFSYDWESRGNCLDTPENGGVMGVYEYSKQLQKLLGRFTLTDVLRAIRRGTDLNLLVASMPDDYRDEALKGYASGMMENAKGEFEPGKRSHEWKYAWKFYDGSGSCPFDPEKDATAAFFWSVEHDVERTEGREQVVEWLFETSKPETWPRFMRQVQATRDELAIVLYAYETERRLRYGDPCRSFMHNSFGVEDPTIDWKRYFDK